MPTATHNRRRIQTEATKTSESNWLRAGHHDPGFAEAVDSDLSKLAELEQNWDGYGAPKIDTQIVDAAKKFIKELPENLCYRPRVVPMSPGNLQFEWHQGKKVLEIEFESPKTIHFLQWDPENEVEEEGTYDIRDIDQSVELIHWFMSGISI